MGNEHYKNLGLANIVGEEWRDIEDFEGYYQVSNMGRVKSLERDVLIRSGYYRRKNERIITQRSKSKNYTNKNASISLDGNCCNFSVARAVFKTFFPKENLDKKVIIHKDFDCSNNCIENLCSGTTNDVIANTLHNKNINRTSKYHNVCKHKKTGRYEAYINIDGKRMHSTFKTEKEAAKAHDFFVKKYKLNRELNFPDEK